MSNGTARAQSWLMPSLLTVTRTTLPLIAACASLVACGDPARSVPDVEEVFVDHGEQSLELTQRFDEGVLRETVITHRDGANERALRVNGELLDGTGTTPSGARVRRFFSTLEPSLLARLPGAQLRYDLAVLAADALLELDAAGQAEAARTLSGGGPATSLCALLGACADADEPRT